MSVQKDLDDVSLAIARHKAKIEAANRKLSILYTEQQKLENQRFVECKHDHCEVLRHSNYYTDEYGTGHTNYYMKVECKDCVRTLADSSCYYQTYQGPRDQRIAAGTLLEVAPWWYTHRGTEIRGTQYNLPGIREITKTEKQYVSVPVKAYVKL